MLILCEGWATGCTLYHATGGVIDAKQGIGTAVCFSANNLVNVARDIRKAMPKVNLLFAADHDDAGINVAEKAAREVGGLIAIPPVEKWDFNDMQNKVSLAQVREAIEIAGQEFGL